LQKKFVSGAIGNGGPLIRVTTSQGDVSLKKATILPLPPTPPAPPKLTALPTEVQQSIDDAKSAASDATKEAKKAAAEARKEAKEAADEAKKEAAEAKKEKDQ